MVELQCHKASGNAIMRELPEWIGKNDSDAIPARVRLRVFERYNGKCAECGVRIAGSIRPAIDHIRAIANGGANAESNLQLLCAVPCHAKKTKRDVATKSLSYRKRLKAVGFKRSRTITKWRRFDGSIRDAGKER
jgi:5-methylcytosine-specific restriction enzyme A